MMNKKITHEKRFKIFQTLILLMWFPVLTINLFDDGFKIWAGIFSLLWYFVAWRVTE